MNLRRALLVAIAFNLSGVLPAAAQTASASPSAPVTVYAAASLQNTLKDVGAAYTAKTGVKVTFSFAASSQLARQIEQGAPADVFVSADAKWMDYLAAKSLIKAASRHDLLTNHLALVAPKDSTVKLKIARGFPIAQALGAEGKLAMADPDSVPAGLYGKASLTALGVWDAVKDRVARGDSVRAALTFVARGEAPLGVVYDTDAKVEPAVRIVGLFPDDSHPRIVYPEAVIAASTSLGAQAFEDFLGGAQARAVFVRYGFTALGR